MTNPLPPSALAEVEAALAEMTEPGRWMLWTSCSWRRIGLDDQSTSVIEPTKHPHDGHPDLSARREDLDGLIAIVNHAPALLHAARENERLRTIINESGLECLPGCDADAHEDLCPYLHPGDAYRALQQRVEILESGDASTAATMGDILCKALQPKPHRGDDLKHAEHAAEEIAALRAELARDTPSAGR